MRDVMMFAAGTTATVAGWLFAAVASGTVDSATPAVFAGLCLVSTVLLLLLRPD
jgi:hypothetical protein